MKNVLVLALALSVLFVAACDVPPAPTTPEPVQETNIPVKFIGVGETPADVEPFDPDRFVDALFADE